MSIPTWPASLPAYPTRNYSEESGVIILRTPMEAGIAKQRRRGQRPDILNCSFEMTREQVETLEVFTKETLAGVSRFNTLHPRKQTNIEVRIVPQDSGKLFDLSMIQLNLYAVNMQFEVIP